MRASDYFTKKCIKDRLKKAGAPLRISHEYRKAIISTFNEGLLDGAYDGKNFSCPKINCLPSKFYNVGYEIGVICRENFLYDGPCPSLVKIAQERDLSKIQKKLLDIIKDRKIEIN